MTTRTTRIPAEGERPAPSAHTEPPRLRGRGLLALLVGGFLANYTFSSVNVAVPFIARDLDATPAQLGLVMGVYATCFAVLLIIGGRLGDGYGRGRLFVVGLLAYTVTSVAAGLVGGVWWLIAIRGAQGLAAALMVPQVLATIQATTRGPARLRAVALFVATSGVGTAAGQVIGGVLLTLDVAGTGWRSVFWFGAVVALAVLPATPALPRTGGDRRGGTDAVGGAVLAVALLAFLVPVTIGPEDGWPPWTIASLVLSAAAFPGFWWWERRREHGGGSPLVPTSVLGHRSVRLGLVMACVFFAGYGAFMYVFALTSQGGLHQSPLVAGLTLLPFAVAFIGVSMGLGVVRRWLGSSVMVVGAAGQITALLMVAAVVVLGRPDPSQWLLQPSLVLLGATQAMMFSPLVNVVMEGVPRAVAGLSGGLFSTVQQAALALGVALYGGVYTAAAPELSLTGAFGVCLAIQATTSVAFGAMALRLRALGRPG
ncbi:MFS transporter [Nocardiopsis aegyptia]|uniref:MFS family permease n=1 Tax=Nocardiopsis aegyptia TaxID=220378 RepID=A0A7Z0JBM7_9ACTN|nr:MFS transporter [Nocardiopsis aegyptia]NYJ35625.1 MFS family permease [Nocardiopsis aegyptia]